MNFSMLVNFMLEFFAFLMLCKLIKFSLEINKIKKYFISLKTKFSLKNRLLSIYTP